MGCCSLQESWPSREKTSGEPQVLTGLLALAFAAGPRLLPMTPERDVAQIENVPPGIEHGGIEVKDAFSRYILRGRSKRGQPVVHHRAFRAGDAREQMPEREGVARTRFVQHDVERGFARGRIRIERIELRERRAERLRSVFKIGRAGTRLHMRGASRA